MISPNVTTLFIMTTSLGQHGTSFQPCNISETGRVVNLGDRYGTGSQGNGSHSALADPRSVGHHADHRAGGRQQRAVPHPLRSKGSGHLETATPKTDRLFTGQRLEDAFGYDLYDYNARWYDPYIRRFVQADPLVPDPGNPQSHNRYAYVGNNPLSFVDPTGHIRTESDGPPPHTAADGQPPRLHGLDREGHELLR